MISRGMIAGLAAIVVLSIITAMMAKMDVMPAFNIIGDWTDVLTAFGLMIIPPVAWLLYVALGAVWGVLLASVPW